MNNPTPTDSRQQQHRALDAVRDLMNAGDAVDAPRLIWQIDTVPKPIWQTGTSGAKVTGSLRDTYTYDDNHAVFTTWRRILNTLGPVTDKPDLCRDDTFKRATAVLASGITVWLTIPV